MPRKSREVPEGGKQPRGVGDEPSAALGEAGRSYPADLSLQTRMKGPLYLKKFFIRFICILCVTLGVSHGLMCSTMDSILSTHHPGELNTEVRCTEKVSRRQKV